MATYNGERYIGEQIQSIARQQGVEVTILASDDGSTDGTLGTAKQTAADCGVSLSFLPNHPPTGLASRNFYLLLQNADISQFDYIALCDQDDIWFDQKLTHACATLKRSNAGAYSCNSVAFWPDGKQVMIRKDYPMRQWDHFFESASHGCTYVLTSETIRKFQKFIEAKRPAIEEIEFHDWLLYAWARQQGIPWYMDKAHLIYYRQHETNELGVNSGWKALFLRLRQLRTGRLRQQSLLIVNALEANAFKLKSVLEVPGFANRLHLASCTFALRRRRRDALLLMLAIILFGI